ncbi:retrovirus-related pol polyprotein from transposon TNT 1-94 [Tanacetum coccineum]
MRLDMSTAYHPQTDRPSERTNHTLEDTLRACVIHFSGSWDTHLPLAEFSYNNSYHSSVRCAPFEALYGRKCMSPVLWAEIRESQLIRPELVQETTYKVILIKERLKAARDCQNSYVGNRRKQLGFEVGDKVILECSLGKVKNLKRSRISIVKVHWNSKRGHEDFMKTSLHTCSLNKLSLEVLIQVGYIGLLADISAPLNVLRQFLFDELRGGLYRDQRLSISEEALGAFGKSQTYSSKLVASKGKEVNLAAGDSDDALVCRVENTVENRIIDSGASFHATYCKEELKRFKLCSGKIRLADDKILDIAGVEDVVLKTYFGTSWTLKDFRYIPGLKRRLISVGQLDEEGYHVIFRDQQWKVTKGSLVVARGNKHGSLYMVEVHPEGIGAIINGSGSVAVWFGEAEESFLHNVSKDKETAETAAGVVGLRIPEEEWRVKDTSLTHLKVFGCDSLVKVKDVYGEAMKCTFIGNGSDEIRHSFRDTKTHQVIRSRDTIFVDLICRARSVTDSSSLANPIQKSQVVLVDISENLAENDSRVAEYRLSSEITQSLGRSSDTSEGSKNSRSFEDSGRSDEEYSKDGASSKEGGSETPQVRRSTKESRASVRYSS